MSSPGDGNPEGNATVDIAVAYYWNSERREGQAVVRQTTELGLMFLRMTPSVGDVVVVDGSPSADPCMEEICARHHARYLHAGRELGLAEAYNIGWRSTESPYVGLMANDILPFPIESMGLLLKAIQAPDVGCVFPYVTEGYAYTQHLDFAGHRCQRTCEPASMTLNLNLFHRSVLADVGGVDETFKVGYYDPLLLMRIRERGHRVVLVGGASAIHVDALTKQLGGSTLLDGPYADDTQRWMQQFPRYAAPGAIGNLLFWRWPCSTTLAAMALWWAAHNVPVRRLRHRAMMLALLAEPYLTSYPSRYGRRPPTSPSRR